ncbi:MAG: four helix bundle protein [Candidatus Omnitrophica bacterium]|nr:four helix bundle protein [Candidatus Omnitrophota bacterium]
MAIQEFDFEKLTVYQKTLEFIHKIFEIYKKLHREFKYTVGDNLVRASVSIANNLAEGSGKKFKREKMRYYSTSLDSARECISVFNVLLKEKLIEEDIYTQIRINAKEITSMLCGLINSIN